MGKKHDVSKLLNTQEIDDIYKDTYPYKRLTVNNVKQVVPQLQLKKDKVEHAFDDDIDILEGLVFANDPSKSNKAKAKALAAINSAAPISGAASTDRLDLEKYINSDFELVAETSLQPFAFPPENAKKKTQLEQIPELYTSPSSADKLASPPKRGGSTASFERGPNDLDESNANHVTAGSPTKELDIARAKMQAQVSSNQGNEASKNMIVCLIQVSLE